MSIYHVLKRFKALKLISDEGKLKYKSYYFYLCD